MFQTENLVHTPYPWSEFSHSLWIISSVTHCTQTHLLTNIYILLKLCPLSFTFKDTAVLYIAVLRSSGITLLSRAILRNFQTKSTTNLIPLFIISHIDSLHSALIFLNFFTLISLFHLTIKTIKFSSSPYI